MKFPCGIEIDESIKGLLFDLDGTLVDNMHLHIDAWVAAGKRFSIPITGKMINDNAGIPTHPLIIKLSNENNWTVDPDQFTACKQSLYREIKKNAGPTVKIEPIIEIADFYKDKLPMTIGTGSSRKNAIAALKDAGIFDWFQIVITADDVINPKPHPEIYLNGAKHIGVDPAHCLVFEDGELGMQSARDAGMQWIDVRDYL